MAWSGGGFVLSGVLKLVLVLLALGCHNGSGGNQTDADLSPNGPIDYDDTIDNNGSSTGGQRNTVCAEGHGSAAMQAPRFLMNLAVQTGWFAAPVIADLDADGRNELIAASYAIHIFDHEGAPLSTAAGNGGRIYAPHVVTDLEGDGTMEVVFGSRHEVYAYEWRSGGLVLKPGWPADTTTAGEAPEIRGMAAGDLDNNGTIEIVVTTTQTQPTSVGGAQVFVFSSNGQIYQPGGYTYPAWPRYNASVGEGGDADRNDQGHDGYGCYGLNVAIGNIDDDDQLEIIVTYDNHHIQAFNLNGEAIDASPYFTNRDSTYRGERMTWGQFIRWADPMVEQLHYHSHQGQWPHPSQQEWLQWTASPPNIVDLDQDGRNEVLGVPSIELFEPYETQAYAIMVLEGDHGDGSRSARRKRGWEVLPRGNFPLSVDGWYPPNGIPAAVTVNIQGDHRPEILVSLNDGYIYAYDASGNRIWRCDYTHGKGIMYASEPTVADLNQDGSPEIVLATYGEPDATDSGNLMVLAADGQLLYDLPLPNAGYNGNGNGAPAAPAVGDLTGDGQLEIAVQTFDHGIDLFTVPGSMDNCLVWPTARGGPLRMGQPNTAD